MDGNATGPLTGALQVHWSQVHPQVNQLLLPDLLGEECEVAVVQKPVWIFYLHYPILETMCVCVYRFTSKYFPCLSKVLKEACNLVQKPILYIKTLF